MKRFSQLFMAAMVAGVFIFSNSANAQEDTMKKIGNGVADTSKTVAHKTVSGGKAVYKGGKRVGHTVGTKTWTGSKWVASKSWKGGKWVAHKTANGTKWVYYKAKGTTKKAL